MHRNAGARRWRARLGTLCRVGLLLAVLLAAVAVLAPLAVLLDAHRTIVDVLRWSLLLTLLITWPVDGLARLCRLTPAVRDLLREERVRLSAWLVLFELLVNTNILGIL